jgi:hypothetical protein
MEFETYKRLDKDVCFVRACDSSFGLAASTVARLRGDPTPF